MPDDWEMARGLNPNSAIASDGTMEANGDYCGKGYTNIEYYINDLTVDSFPSGTVEVSPKKAAVTASPSVKPSVAVSSAPVTTTSAVSTQVQEGTYQIQNVNSGLYLNVANGTAANGTNIQQWGSNSVADYDTFRIVSCGDGYFKIYSLLAGGTTYVLDVSGKKTDNGTNIALYTDNGGKNQQFKFESQGDGTFAIKTRISGDASCLDVENYSKDSGANVHQWVFNGTSNQLWRLVPVNVASPVPSMEPTPSMELTPSIEPSPSVEPLETPGTVKANVKVSVSGGETDVTNCLTKTITFTGTSSENVDLSKVKIRYYYTADGSQNQNVWIDSAALSYSVAPYYVNIAEDVKGAIVKMGNAKDKADTYLEVSFGGAYTFNNTVNGQVAFRIAKDDWSSFTQTNDYSYGDDAKVVVYYDGKVIAGVEP